MLLPSDTAWVNRGMPIVAAKGGKMAQSEDLAPDWQTFDSPAGVRGVRDDMVAIFGPDQRADLKPLLNRAEPVRSSGSRRMVLAAVTICGVATMLTAGVVGGMRVLNTPHNGSPESSGVYKVAEFSPGSPTEAAAAESLAQPNPVPVSSLKDGQVAATPSLTSATASASVSPAATTPIVVEPSSAEAAVRRSSGAPAERADVVAPAELPARLDRTVGAVGARALITPDFVPGPSCSSAYECLEPQLRSTEQGVAAAYERATIAGVRPKTLRDYRAEWIRARSLATKRPQEAIRLYGMIGSDLRLLAVDPTID
jgi:hypothetical protein